MREEFEVLVVDDAVDTAANLAELLEMDGYSVRTAAEGAEALALSESKVPDCVILDINMPGMDGYDLAVALREKYNHGMVLIALTGMGDDSVRVSKTMPLVDHFFKKPVDYSTIKKILRPLNQSI